MALSALLAGMLFVSAPEPQTKLYTLDASKTTTEVKVGKDGQFQLQIQPAPGYKINADAPLKIALSSSGLKLQKSLLKHADAKEKKAEAPQFAVGFNSEAAGAQSIQVDAEFVVCDVKICERKKDKITVAVNVTP